MTLLMAPSRLLHEMDCHHPVRVGAFAGVGGWIEVDKEVAIAFANRMSPSGFKPPWVKGASMLGLCQDCKPQL